MFTNESFLLFRILLFQDSSVVGRYAIQKTCTMKLLLSLLNNVLSSWSSSGLSSEKHKAESTVKVLNWKEKPSSLIKRRLGSIVVVELKTVGTKAVKFLFIV